MNTRRRNRMCDRWLGIWLVACGVVIVITADDPLQFFEYVALSLLILYNIILSTFLLHLIMPDILEWLKGN